MGAVLDAYAAGTELINDELYEALRRREGTADADFDRHQPIGQAGKKHCVTRRKVRWYQQSLKRQQLNVVYEPILWLTNDPVRCFSDNRRVLQEHTPRHQRLMAAGGENRNAANNDGAYRITAGKSYSNQTAGRIPRNVLSFTYQAREVNELRAQARARALPCHGALMPLALAVFLIRFLTRKGQLVVDPFAGWGTTAKAAEMTERLAHHGVDLFSLSKVTVGDRALA